jgi:hypothetical protein
VNRERTDGLIRWQRRRSGHSALFRLAVGPVEICAAAGYVDLLLLPPLGSFVTATWVRDPDTMPDTVRRAVREGRATSRFILNTRPLFVGLLGGNLVEIGVWRWGGVLTWFEDDMRRLARRRVRRHDPATCVDCQRFADLTTDE